MTDILIRNVDDETARALKKRAKKHGRSLQAELKLLLAESVDREDRWEEFRRVQEFVSEGTRQRPQTDSTLLVREDRDR
jgi:plasmid stability protein